MSLNFDLSAIPLETRTVTSTYDDEFHGIKKGDTIMNPVTNQLIWATMAVDIGVIDDKTVDEFIFRIRLYEKLFGAMLRYSDERGDRPFTADDVIAHKGLRTNVFPMKTRAQWLKRMGESFERELRSEIAKAKGEEPRQH